MREIKFRGKRVDNGEWIYGNLLILSTCDERKRTEHIIVPISYDENDCYSPSDSDDLCFETFYKVLPETVGQFVELKDSKGIEIYEGDIIQINCTPKLLREVVYKQDECRFIMEYEDEREHIWDFMDISYRSLYEIIGNIKENPELLEKK